MDIDHIDRELGKQGARTPKMRHHVRATGQHDNVFLFGTLNYPINATMDDDTRDMLVHGDFTVRCECLTASATTKGRCVCREMTLCCVGSRVLMVPALLSACCTRICFASQSTYAPCPL